VGEVFALEVGQQLVAREVEIHAVEPGGEQVAGIVGPEVAAQAALSGVALGDHALDHAKDGLGVGLTVGAAGQDPRSQPHRGVGPLGG